MDGVLEIEEFKGLVSMITTWIPVNILMPEDCLRITNYHNYLYTDSVLVKTINRCFISKRSRHQSDLIWKWVGSKQQKENVTHWKPFDYDTISDECVWALLKSHFEQMNKTKIHLRKRGKNDGV